MIDPILKMYGRVLYYYNGVVLPQHSNGTRHCWDYEGKLVPGMSLVDFHFISWLMVGWRGGGGWGEGGRGGGTTFIFLGRTTSTCGIWMCLMSVGGRK